MLYKLNSDGKSIQFWDVEVQKNQFRTISGKLNGKAVTSKWTTAKEKNTKKTNATTAEAQAKKQAIALTNAKKAKGYCDSIEAARKGKSFFEPMSAEKFIDFKADIDWPGYTQPKLDGVRVIITKDEAKSRTGKASPAGELIRQALLKDRFFEGRETIRLDGELYNHSLKKDFNKLTSFARTEKYDSVEKAKEAFDLLQIWVYDCIDSENPRETFSQRLVRLMSLQHPKLVITPTHRVTCEEELEKWYLDYLEDGYEGLMYREDAVYENKRTSSLLKYKPMETEEFQCVDVIEGEGNRQGMAGKFVLLSPNGNTFEANMRGNFAYYKRLLEDKEKIIGKMITVRYQNLTPGKQVPRFGVALAIRDYE